MIVNLNKQKKTIFLVFFYLIFLIISLVILDDYGVHIEEKFHRLNGLYWLNYIANLFNFSEVKLITETKISFISDYTLSPVSTYNKYGIILDLPVAILETILDFEDVRNIYYFKHLLSHLIFLASSLAFFKILEKRYRSFYLGMVGALLYITSPRIFGDSFFYKDVLFLSFFMFTIYFFIKSIQKFNYKNLLFLAFFSSICTNLRIFAILIPFILIFIMIIKNFYLKEQFNFLKKIFFYIIFFFLLLYIFWPYLWENPIEKFLELFLTLKDNLINYKIYFNGNFINNRTLPDYYIPVWIFISSPFLITILFFFVFGLCLLRVLKRYFKITDHTKYYDLWRGKNEEYDFIFLIIIIIFFSLFLFLNAPLYNGWRLVYFFNIFIIYFAINFIFRIKNYFNKNDYKYIYTFLTIILVCYNFFALVKTHPFQSFYFNSLISDRVKNNFEGDYHGIATKHFFENILIQDNNKVIKIAVASHTPIQRGVEALPEELRERIRIVGQEYRAADYIYKNNISEVDAYSNKKYQIPKNFYKFDQLKIDGTILYQIFKLKDSN